ncbi:Receptor-like protein 12 [Vitis vinifera]|uniref:Receptor-like protein 12 n=1 Tax=Vitis vinifera TaxID=29760 RepID=A0A438DPY5_VITVI|nr:Receptor-like protein 12 [Vitis vinifera]
MRVPLDDPSAYPKVATWKSHGEGEGEESDCCSWDGVECDRETGHVIGLHLASSCLYGSIKSSSTLFSLVHLRRLDLSDNDFNYSVIPFGVGQLSRLRSLDLSYSRFSGQIPSELLALSKLVFLDLSANPMLQLQKPGLRNLVQNLTHLKKLHLSQVNIFSTIPHELASLSSLTSLFLRECGLHGEFPMKIFQLPSLQYLTVRYNPDLIGYLPEFQETSPLKMLYLGGTSFYGELPASIGSLGSLTELDISSCNFTGLVPSPLGHIPQLSVLDLSNNSFSGQIPSFMANLTQLTYLDLSSNDFSVGTLAWLVELHMLSKLKDLTEFQLSNNRLSLLSHASTNATFPKFRLLGLNSCNLTQIPDFLQNQDELELLFLVNNKIHGPIPKWLWNMSKETLEILALRQNLLTGFDLLPAVLRWSKMRILDLASNMLQGSLPVPPPSTYIYSVSGNKLTGEIPPLICNLTSLRLLDLSDNNFSGGIPQCLTNLSSSLFVLNLRGNNLHGAIPQICTNTSSLRMIDLSGNQLQGQIPRSLANCIMVEELVLGNNMINDNFPSWLGSLPRLQVICLQNTSEIGMPWELPYPTSLANLTLLEALDLSQNKLSREIPQQLVQLTFLAYFNVSHNHLTGPIPQGKQFATFPDTSFDGNPGLCGSPLSRACGNSEASPPAPSTPKQGSSSEFDWKIVLMGYGSGLVIGISTGYCLTAWKHEWFVKTFGRRQPKWRRKARRGHRG